MSDIAVGERVKMISEDPVHGFGKICTGAEGIVTNIDEDGYWIDFEEQSGWCGARSDIESLTAKPPTLETMLTEWRDLEARAQAVQAEADALFEHAGQCHGEIVVRLAELGWGAPRGVVTLDDSDGWVEWEGGDQPIPNGTIIDTRYRDGEERFAGEVGVFGTATSVKFWIHEDRDNDIVAYRLTPSTPQ